MRHYIAYHKVEEWGPVDDIGPEFKHWTARRKSDLEKTLGQNLWVISGERIGGAMSYKLCQVFRPEKITSSGGGHYIKGMGTSFVPHADLTGEDWFGKLLDQQQRFSYSLKEIKDGTVINALLAFVAPAPVEQLPVEVAHPQTYFDAATTAVMVNTYERDPDARAACVAHYGVCCLVCGFDFEAQYGERGKAVIDVHHLKPLSEVKPGYRVDPIEDLRPVCHNCHTIIHQGDDQLSLAEAKALVRMKYRKDV